jgi:hypothetical protein
MFAVSAFFLIILSPVLVPLIAAGFHLATDILSGQRR